MTIENPLLSAQDLSKHFGGLQAVRGVTLAIARGAIHGLIGPNGAGKSTLANLLSGVLQPSSGRVVLQGHDMTGQPPERFARRGLQRSYQHTNIFMPFTVWENARLAAQAPRAHALWRVAERDERVNERARRSLERTGLMGRAAEPAAALSHGEQRQLEIAMTLATEPDVLLLDEPLAGMGGPESERMVGLLSDLRKDHAILLIEHDMDAVFALADQLTVMVDGAVIASGSPDDIRADRSVQAAYLGES